MYCWDKEQLLAGRWRTNKLSTSNVTTVGQLPINRLPPHGVPIMTNKNART